ncbi:hypothetical protein GEV33_011467 [Tenebrio molitor]|uniref:UNC-45/Cro1/She4 central domain-containing protein n=1 Tax=Tenebrio molitor TaxID=7067 RepID=A0A8J6HAY4_TENMO|nr:hypothetical protein GEV33_011467 [Tenebrio molitor]
MIQPVLERLHRIVQERSRQNAQTSTKIESMTKIAFDLTADKEKRETAMNNLLVLARENAGSSMMINSPIVQQIRKLLKVEKNRELYITGVRIIGELCKHDVDKTRAVMKDVGIPWFLEILDSTCPNQVNAAQYCIQQILNIFSGMDNKPDTKPDKELCTKHKKDIDMILTCLVYSINNRVISGLARDAIIELLIRNIHYTTLSWAEQLVDAGGVGRLMECASELEEYKYESAMNITPSTRTIAAVCLSRVYDNMYYDAAREKFMEKIQDFIKDKLLSPEIESKVRVTVAITALLRGPLDVGNAIIGKEGIIEMILVMANSEDVLQEKVVCECLIAAARKADEAKAIISQGVHILKQLYKSKEDAIRVRALVGLWKLGSSGGTMPPSSPSLKGLSYLTLDAEVKEKVVEDKAALQSLIELAKTGDQSCLFGVVTTLVNLCNAYEKQEVIPEMVELAKFAKQHIPEEHELDDPDFISKRILILGKEGVTTALVALSKTESPNSQELIARVFNALCSEQELRGTVVQQGGSKALIPLALKGTDKGKRHAAQALSRIAITMNPEVAFPGQRSLEVIRPMVSLLHPDCSGLENFEALMGLCNIAQMNETARQRILKEGGLAKIEHYMFEDHQYLCRAATQCLTNMTMSPDVVQIHEGENDKMKYLAALAMDDDPDTAMAAAGAIAILTGASKKCCAKLFDSKNWMEAMHVMLANPTASMQYRGVCVVRNIIEQSKELAEKLMETDVMEILMALTKLPPDEHKQIIQVAEDALKLAEQWGVIKKPGELDD